MASSWLHSAFSNGRIDQYSPIAMLTEDVELEKRRLIEEIGSSNDSSEYIDTLPSIRQYTEKHRYSHRKCCYVILFTITIIAASLSLFHHYKSVSPASIDQTPGLPRWPLPFTTDESFNEEAMEMWVAKGQLPSLSSTLKLDFSKHVRIDGITLWVNGSDQRHRQARLRFAANISRIDHPPFSTIRHRSEYQSRSEDRDKDLQNTDQRYREQNELLYSLRSNRMNLENLGTQHVLATDYWDEGTNTAYDTPDRIFQGRRGQVPTWLNTSSDTVKVGKAGLNTIPALRLHHDWETFVPLVETQEDVTIWKQRRLPSFNSMAVEALLGVNLPGLSEYAFLTSDDMFLGQPLSTADFITPLYGPVLMLKMDQQIEYPRVTPMTGIEFASLDYSISLLNKRFGTRLFPYLQHIHKSISKPLLIESRMMWKKPFEEASLKRFRGDGISANSHALSYGLIIERHREALLWSFLVAKLDVNGDGKIDKVERQRAFRLMNTSRNGDIVAHMSHRTSFNPDNIMRNLDSVLFPRHKAVRYTFSSSDGHILNQPSAEYTKETNHDITKEPLRLWTTNDQFSKVYSFPFCRVSMNTCWQRTDDSVNSIFTRFAFKVPQCGDCLIAYLVQQSGNAGLDAFLPESTLKPVPSRSKAAVPDWVPAHLPIEDDWRSIDFSLSSVASINRGKGWNRRSFSIHLIQRYAYVAGDTSISFKMLLGPQSATDLLIEIKDTRPAFICLNDDIEEKLDETNSIMQYFFKLLWPSSNPFEKTS